MQIKKHIIVPVGFFCIGLAVYIYNGIEWNTWLKYLPNMGIYLVIVTALGVALKKKEEIKNNRNY